MFSWLSAFKAYYVPPKRQIKTVGAIHCKIIIKTSGKRCLRTLHFISYSCSNYWSNIMIQALYTYSNIVNIDEMRHGQSCTVFIAQINPMVYTNLCLKNRERLLNTVFVIFRRRLSCYFFFAFHLSFSRVNAIFF